jgi:hypothetical protein
LAAGTGRQAGERVEIVDGTVTVNFATSNGTATAGSDYTARSGTVTFAAGETTKTVTVPITGDGAVEGNETFTISLAGASGATIADDEDRKIFTEDLATGPWFGLSVA